MEQEVKSISVKDLVLWTENPRDPISEDASDQDVVDKALNDRSGRWALNKLAKEMGDIYDFSELPTIVYHDDKPIVYDGNRRIILGKIKHNLVTTPKDSKINIPEFPAEIPCNVCTKERALKNIFRKHSDTGSWLPLERDVFLNRHMDKEKSPFLLLEEETNIISENPHLNKGFVKEEIFKEETLRLMGFEIKEGKILSRHSDEEAKEILSDISRKVKDKEITTRKNRGKVIEVLDPKSQQIIDQNKAFTPRQTNFDFSRAKEKDDSGESQKEDRQEPKERVTPRTKKKEKELFGGKLFLDKGKVSDLYRDIVELYRFYNKEKVSLSATFPNLIRMSLRLLCELAAKDKNRKLADYLSRHFDTANANLNQDLKTTLANQNVTDSSIVQLLQTGAHAYDSSSNIEQTIALSIIVGEILTLTHGRSGNSG